MGGKWEEHVVIVLCVLHFNRDIIILMFTNFFFDDIYHDLGHATQTITNNLFYQIRIYSNVSKY